MALTPKPVRERASDPGKPSAGGLSGGSRLSLTVALRENSFCSGLDDAVNELTVIHSPLAKPSDRLPELVTTISEPVLGFRRHLLMDGALQKPIAFEVA